MEGEQRREPPGQADVSIYGSVNDLTDATGNLTDPIGTVDAENAELAQSIVSSASAGDTDFRTVGKQEIPDNAYSVDSESECGGSTIQGPEGGLYCVPDGDASPDGVPDPDETAAEVSSIVETRDHGELEDYVADATGVESVTLPEIDDREQQERLASAIAHAGETGITDNVAEITTRSGDESGMFNFNDRRLEINEDINEEDLEGQVDDGYAVGEDLEWLALHELGHANHADMIDNDLDRAEEMFERGVATTPDGEWVGRERVDLIDDEVSSYGRSSPGELVAEVFAGKALGKDFPDEVMDIYEEWDGPDTWQNYRGGGS